MFRSNPLVPASLVSASLAVALAAGAAGVFTIATSTSVETDHAVKSDRLATEQGLSAIMFNAEPMAGRMTNEPAAASAPPNGPASEQVLPERTRGTNENAPPQGCESGLSPDLSPSISTRSSRCLADNNTTAQFASLH